ncbi:MAG: class I SAM-dependent methyltransferase [Candidatus Acidiferrales bacterium]
MTQWWSVNWKNRSRFALRHPAYAFKAVIRDLLAADERFLASLTGATASQIRHFLDEPFQEIHFFDHLRGAESQFSGVRAIGADLYAKRVLLQYAIIRAYKPDHIVETGVANGVSSAYLLLALGRNQKGSLHSIDVGDGSFLPAGKKTGWIVPDWLRERWTLHLGDAHEILPQVLAHLGSLDVFIHDSLHTYEHMKFEYEQAYPHLRPGGILISDDALWNPAFSEFARSVVAPSARVIRGIGILQKQTQ